ncbi:unnamed protein product [Effrenium voratum]|nr:unnamed protein product [Effrenium voratum]
MLEVQLQAMRMLLASSVLWEYYVNLSDTHYPAEAMSVIGSYLWLHDGTNYARITSTKYYDPTLQGGKAASYGGPRQEDLYVACDRTLAFECEGHLFSVAPGVKYPPLLTGIKAASGPEWLVLSKDFVEYVIQGLNSSLVRDIYDDLTALSIPEETFFQTLLLSSRFCHTVLRHEFLYLDLYDAPWRRSEKSDFPFQSPRPLNGSHLRDIAMEEPWFVRKVDSSLAPSRALRGALEAGIARRERPRWLEVAAPTAPLLAALGGTLEARGLQRLVSPSGRGHWAPQRLRLRLRTEPTSASGRPSRVGGGLELAERVARPKRHRGWELPPVVAMRVGCGWDEAAFDFRGEVSVIGCQSNVSLVAYLRNVGFEGEVAIHWLREGRLLRQSGGHVPKGFTMFVDHLSPSIASPGRWSVSLTDVDSGNRIGERSFLLFGVDAKDTWPSLRDYEEFFDFSPAFSGRMRAEKEAPLLWVCQQHARYSFKPSADEEEVVDLEDAWASRDWRGSVVPVVARKRTKTEAGIGDQPPTRRKMEDDEESEDGQPHRLPPGFGAIPEDIVEERQRQREEERILQLKATQPCRFSKKCKKRDCPNAHPEGRDIDSELNPCAFGRRCKRQGCFYDHPEGRMIDDDPTKGQCKFGIQCARADCLYSHPDGRAAVGMEPKVCFFCRQDGHIATECPRNPESWCYDRQAAMRAQSADIKALTA